MILKKKKMMMSLRHLCLLQNETARQQKKKYYVQIEEKKNENRRNTSCTSSRIARCIHNTCKREKTRVPLALWCETTSEGNETKMVFLTVREKEDTLCDV